LFFAGEACSLGHFLLMVRISPASPPPTKWSRREPRSEPDHTRKPTSAAAGTSSPMLGRVRPIDLLLQLMKLRRSDRASGRPERGRSRAGSSKQSEQVFWAWIRY